MVPNNTKALAFRESFSEAIHPSTLFQLVFYVSYTASFSFIFVRSKQLFKLLTPAGFELGSSHLILVFLNNSSLQQKLVSGEEDSNLRSPDPHDHKRLDPV